jgi:hypothetical protein
LAPVKARRAVLPAHVVRAFAGPLPLTGEAEIKLPKDLDTTHATVVAFVQRESDIVAQVLSCKL